MGPGIKYSVFTVLLVGVIVGCGPRVADPPATGGTARRDAGGGDAGKGGPAADEGDPKDGVYRNSRALLAKMPREVYPKLGERYDVEPSVAAKWGTENLIGKTVEWTCTVSGVSVYGEKSFNVTVNLDLRQPWLFAHVINGVPFGEPFKLGDQPCRAVAARKVDANTEDSERYRFTDCTPAEATAMTKMEGKRVTMRGSVAEVVVWARGQVWHRVGRKDSIAYDNKYLDEVVVGFLVTGMSLDGVFPASEKAAVPKKP